MANKLEKLLTLLSLLAAVKQVNSAFYHDATAHMSRRKDIDLTNCESSGVQQCH